MKVMLEGMGKITTELLLRPATSEVLRAAQFLVRPQALKCWGQSKIAAQFLVCPASLQDVP